MLVGIPLWPHQLISLYFHVSFSKAFFIPFDFYSHICSFLCQYPYNSPLTILGFWVTCSWLSLTATSTTASHIHIRHIKKFCAYWYAVHGHMAAALNSYTHTTWVRFWGLGHLWSQNDDITSWLRLTANSNCYLYPHDTYTKFLSTLICCPWAYGSSLKQLYPHYLAYILGFWVTCGVKMMS